MSERMTNRRDFIKMAGLAGLAVCAPRCSSGAEPQEAEVAASKFDHPLGVQLYTLREVLPQDPEGTLRSLADIGYTEVEALGWDLRQQAPILNANGLRAVSAHFPAPLVTGNWDVWMQAGAASEKVELESAVSFAAEQGLDYAVIAYLFAQERGSLDFFRRFADQMNQAGEAFRAVGIQLGYHNHAFEFEPLEGQRPFDILKERFDANLVQWELDVFWLKMGGLDPAAVLREFSGRVPLVHLKDAAAGAQPRFQESQVPPTDFVSVGSGQLDFPAILKTAVESGVRHYFVEQDHTPGPPLESLRQSYEYLRGVEI